MSSEVVKVGSIEYEPRVLNGLTEPGARQYAYKKLSKYQDGKGWVFNPETKEFNPVSNKEEYDRELYMGLSNKLLAMFASDKRAVLPDIDELLELAETDEKGFMALYEAAITANPGFKEIKEPKDPN